MTILYGPAQGEAKKINKLYGGAVVMTSLNRDTSVQTVLVTAIDEDKFAKKFSVWAGGAGKGVFVNDEITAIKIEHSSSSSTSDYAFFLTGADPSVPGGQKDVQIFGDYYYFPVADVAEQWGITITSSNVPVVDNIPVSPTYADQSWKITRMYGPAGTIVSEVTGEIQPGGDGNVVAFNGETFSEAAKSMTYFWELLSATADQISLGISHLNNPDYYFIRIYSNGQYINKYIDSGDADRMALYGITISDTPTTGGIDYIDLTRNGYSPMAKLIYQGFGHYDYGYGSVEYYTDSSHTTKTIGKLRSTSEVNSLAGSTSSWTATVDGQSVSNSDIISVELNSKVSTVPTYFLSGCTSLNNVDIHFANILNLGDYFLSGCSNFNGTIVLPYKLLNIGDQFLQGCSAFNQVLSFPESVRSIGDNFLSNCSSYNKALALPDSLVSIGRWFLYQCRLFNQNLSLPSSLISIGTAFISMNIPESGVGAMTGTIDVGNLPATIIASSNFSFACISSSAPMCTTGITISGGTRADWMTKFPNGNNSGLRRKLVDAGY